MRVPWNLKPLLRSFYGRDTISVARELLGKLLVHRSQGCERVGRIVETEAYLGPHDLAAHSCRGLTGRTKVMFGPPGHAYQPVEQVGLWGFFQVLIPSRRV